MSNPTSPHLFNKCEEIDENIIINLLKINPHAIFLRKVNYKFPNEKLIELSSWDLTNNKNNKNEKTNKNIFILFYLLFFSLLFFFITICFTKIFMNTQPF